MSRQEILDRERRWRMPAVVAAVIALALLLVSGFVQGNALTADTQAEQAIEIDASSGSFMFGAVVAALGFLATIGPLLYVFQAARARSPALRGAMIGFVVIGPALMAAQTVVQAAALKDVASEFVAAGATEPAGEVVARTGGNGDRKDADRDDEPLPGLGKGGEHVEEVTFYPDGNAYEVESAAGAFSVYEFAADDEDRIEEQLEAADFDFTIEEDGDQGDSEILSIREDSSLYSAAGSLLFPAFIALIVGIFYTSLQAMRTGLFTRFFGTLAMALSVAILLLGALLPALAVFLAGTVLVITGRTPRGRPPAWDAGEAIPWPKPGEEEAKGAAEVLEGDASEVEDSDADSESPHAERRQRAKRKKRKRR